MNKMALKILQEGHLFMGGAETERQNIVLFHLT